MADLRAAGNKHSRRRPMAFSPRRTVIVATVAALVCAAGAWAQPSGAAQTTLEKIEGSGKVVLGGGCAEKVEYMGVAAQNTLPLVRNGTLDIGCGPTTNNQARQQQVAFA